MKTIQACFNYLPQSVGGTEVYVAGLARELMQMGHDVRVAIVSNELKPNYSYDGILVDVLNIPQNIKQPHDKLNTAKVNFFQNTLPAYIRQIHPDIVHFHPLTLSPMLPLIETVHKIGIPSVCTYHTPTVTCGRGDMLRWGNLPCDGRMDWQKCTSCVLNQKGMPKPISKLLVNIPYSLFQSQTKSSRHLISRKVYSLFSIPVQRMSHIREWCRVVPAIDRWVAPSNWVKEVLLRNGLTPEQITVCRQGLCYDSKPKKDVLNSPIARKASDFDSTTWENEGFPESNQSPSTKLKPNKNLRLGYLGRIHVHKGIHLLLQAMEILNGHQDIRLKIVGPLGSVDNRYRANFLKHTQNDSRISWIPMLKPSQIGSFLRNIDLLVVPSVWLETGPMNILEAWAAGIPVLGSNRGGIAEWINEYGGGWLFEPDSADDLAGILLHLKNNSSLLKSMSVPTRVRSIADVAEQMAAVYRHLTFCPRTQSQ